MKSKDKQNVTKQHDINNHKQNYKLLPEQTKNAKQMSVNTCKYLLNQQRILLKIMKYDDSSILFYFWL
jgi:hypothetical protein